MRFFFIKTRDLFVGDRHQKVRFKTKGKKKKHGDAKTRTTRTRARRRRRRSGRSGKSSFASVRALIVVHHPVAAEEEKASIFLRLDKRNE